MKDKVYVKIKGLTMEEKSNVRGGEIQENDNIEVISVAKYAVIGGKEYIKYEEVYDGADQKSVNLIKISDDCVEISKKGAITTHMDFCLNKRTVSYYETPYGSINLGIYTSVLDIEREEDRIIIILEYSMEVNNQQMSECRVEIEITSQGKLDIL